MRRALIVSVGVVALVALSQAAAQAQVDQERARQYFAEVRTLCEREAGRLWGVSLCGPMAIVDVATATRATSEPPPAVPPPPTFGYANTAVEWGDTRWTTVVWKMLPVTDRQARDRLLLHELFHRIQPQLGLLVPEVPNSHLDTLEGRYWLRLEWRALATALGAQASERGPLIADALAFRHKRLSLFDGAAESERRMEINEGLAQYTGTVAAAETRDAAVADAREQLRRYENEPTFVRVFPYPAGAAYGLLLDAWRPGWTRTMTKDGSLPQWLADAAGIAPASDPDDAARRYGAAELWASEVERDRLQKARVAELRERFVEGPVVVVPRVGKVSFSFVTTGMTPIPGAGTVYPTCRITAEWGSLDAELALMAADNSTITVPGPATTHPSGASGPGWTLKLVPGWEMRAGARGGDLEVARVSQPPPAR